MQVTTCSFALLCFVVSFFTAPTHSLDDYHFRSILYVRTHTPKGSDWKILPHLPRKDLQVTFTIALPQRNLDELEKRFWRNADPTDPLYAKHMTREQIQFLVSPPIETKAKVLKWISSVNYIMGGSEVLNITNEGDALQIQATVKFVEELFQTKIHFFHSAKYNITVAKHMGPLSIPVSLKPCIELVTGITEFPPTRLPLLSESIQPRTRGSDNQCNIPYTLKKLYNVPLDLLVSNPNANQSIYSEVSVVGSREGFGASSLSDWDQANNIPPNAVNCILGNDDQDYSPTDTDPEAILDVQMVTGMAPGAKTCFYIMKAGNGWMYEFARTTPHAPLVISMSYGWFETEECSTSGIPFLGNCTGNHIPNSRDYVRRTNIEFMKLGLVGHSLVAASGDDGTAGGHSSNDNCKTMGPIFPGSSPYVTTVGATSIEASGTHMDAMNSDDQPPLCKSVAYQCKCSTSTNEQVAQTNNTAGFVGGGGFAVYQPMPSYQRNAVNSYIKSGVKLPDSKYWNATNRAYPDVATVGENFCCITNKNSPCFMLAGTSASAPLFASMITLLNQDRLNANKTPLGFFNPVIYKMFETDAQKYFNNNFDHANNGGECGSSMGFDAIPGHWTPLTGVGSPRFDKIREFVSSLP